jgi:hypothetical protein
VQSGLRAFKLEEVGFVCHPFHTRNGKLRNHGEGAL